MSKNTNVTEIKAVDTPKNDYNLHITLEPGARIQAEDMLRARGLEVRENFDGPIFKDIMGYQVNGDWVAVTLKDGATYAYPAANISRIKHFLNKE